MLQVLQHIFQYTYFSAHSTTGSIPSIINGSQLAHFRRWILEIIGYNSLPTEFLNGTNLLPPLMLPEADFEDNSGIISKIVKDIRYGYLRVDADTFGNSVGYHFHRNEFGYGKNQPGGTGTWVIFGRKCGSDMRRKTLKLRPWNISQGDGDEMHAIYHKVVLTLSGIFVFARPQSAASTSHSVRSQVVAGTS